MNLKVFIYSLLLMITISADLVHSAYELFAEKQQIEMTIDITGEKDSKEKTEMDEEACDLLSSLLKVKFQHDGYDRAFDHYAIYSNHIFYSIPSPPPDRG